MCRLNSSAFYFFFLSFFRKLQVFFLGQQALKFFLFVPFHVITIILVFFITYFLIYVRLPDFSFSWYLSSYCFSYLVFCVIIYNMFIFCRIKEKNKINKWGENYIGLSRIINLRKRDLLLQHLKKKSSINSFNIVSEIFWRHFFIENIDWISHSWKVTLWPELAALRNDISSSKIVSQEKR